MTLDLPGRASPALHLVRHGQSTWNVEGLVQGQTAHPGLTGLGLEQARRAAGSLTGTDPVRLLTSDLRRAVQTAEIIGAAVGLDPIPTTMLREQSLGAIEGMSTEMAAAEWERAAGGALDEYGDPVPNADLRIQGGESMRDVSARVGALLATPWVTEAAGDVILVTHGDTIRILLTHLLGEDLDNPTWRPIGNGEVHSVYRTTGGRIVHVHANRSDTPDPQP